MNQSTTSSVRTVSVQMVITEQARPTAYAVIPVEPEPGFIRAFEVRKKSAEGATVATYRCSLWPEGGKKCTCPAGQFRKQCKHLDALTRFFMLDADLVLAVEGQRLYLAQSEKTVENERLNLLRLQNELKAQIEAQAQAKPARKPARKARQVKAGVK